MQLIDLLRLPVIILSVFVLGIGGLDAQGQTLAERIRELDKDNDQAISMEEAGEQLWQRFADRDVDLDGYNTAA